MPANSTPRNRIIHWWLSLKITDKFGVVFLLLLAIGLLQTTVAISASRSIGKTVNTAQASLDAQRLSLEMIRDWQNIQYQEYLFFSDYTEIGYESAKKQYAIPAGESLSNIIRSGAEFRRLISSASASDQWKDHDHFLKELLAELSNYSVALENAVHLASESYTNNEERIAEQLEVLQTLKSSIEPKFTELTLMAQNEVILARIENERAQRSAIFILIGVNIIAITFALLIVVVFRRNIAEKVGNLTHASEQIQRGHLDDRVEIDSIDEFKLIASAFNRMVDAIQEQTEALKQFEYRYQALFNQSNDAMYIINLDGKIRNVNQRALNMHNYPKSEMVGRSFHDFVVQDDPFISETIQNLMRNGEDLPVFEHLLKRKDGSYFPVESNFSRVEDENGQPLYLQLVSREISERKEVEARLRHMALYDNLTNLPNRTLLYIRLTQALEEARHNDHLIAVLYIDLDGFKQINDQFGHELGDRFLIRIAELIQSSLRDSDLVARVGGDEFVAVLDKVAKAAFAEQVGDKILHNLAREIVIDGQCMSITASLGISLYPRDGDEIETLIKNADQAMYDVKSTRKNGWTLFNR